MRWSYAAVVVLCLAVGLQTIRSDNYFLGDDFGLIHHLHDSPFSRLLSYFSSDWTEGIYGNRLDELRPFLAFSYWFDAQLFGAANAVGYHITNVVLHILNALLVLGIARSIAPREPGFALLAASLFALMPSHAEPVAWISGRVDSLVSVFYLGAFLCFVRFRLEHRPGWLLATLVAFVCGLFAKQSMVTLPLLLVAFDVVWPVSDQTRDRSWPTRAWPHVVLFVLLALYLALRHTLFGNAVREDLVTVDSITRFIWRQDSYARELMPAPNAAPKIVKLLGEVLTVGTLVICLGWVMARRQAYRQALRRVLFGVAWYAITIAPMVVTYLSARHLYVTAAGLSMAMASLLLPGGPVEERRRSRTRMAMAGVLVAFYAVAAIWNASIWVTSGQESGRFASTVSRLAEAVPRGSIVFVSAPEWNRDGWFWSWSTPFALQSPFTSENFYQRFRVVERSLMYCCPPDQWWAARKDTLTALLNAAVPQGVTYIEFAPANPDGARVSTRAVDGPALKKRIEAAVGKPVESFTTALTPDEAAELSRVLFE